MTIMAKLASLTQSERSNSRLLDFGGRRGEKQSCVNWHWTVGEDLQEAQALKCSHSARRGLFSTMVSPWYYATFFSIPFSKVASAMKMFQGLNINFSEARASWSQEKNIQYFIISGSTEAHERAIMAGVQDKEDNKDVMWWQNDNKCSLSNEYNSATQLLSTSIKRCLPKK